MTQRSNRKERNIDPLGPFFLFRIVSSCDVCKFQKHWNTKYLNNALHYFLEGYSCRKITHYLVTATYDFMQKNDHDIFFCWIGRMQHGHPPWKVSPGVGYSNVKESGMLVILLRSSNHGFWSHLGTQDEMPLFLVINEGIF